MKFGDDYFIEDASDEDYNYLFLGDYYYKDLTPAYIEILKASGFKEDLDTYYTPAYILDNGVVYIEVLPYYNFGNCLEIYFEQTHKPVVTDFALSINELDIVKGATYQLTPIFTPDGATNRITWTSDNEDAATVVDGLVTISETALADTKVTITATCLNGMSDSCTFTVKEDAISGIMFTENSYKIAPGETIETSYALLPYGVESAFITLTYDVNPADAGVSVANNGKVTASETAVAGTSVTLTVTCNGAYTATATVTVKSAAVTHTLNKDFFSLPGDSNYKTYSKTTSDGAYYEAQCASTHGIQIRSKNENSGIIGQFAGKACKSITITFDSNTDSARVVEIYASTSAFNISDMYGSSVDKVGTISKSGNSFTYTFTDSYSYIGLSIVLLYLFHLFLVILILITVLILFLSMLLGGK